MKKRWAALCAAAFLIALSGCAPTAVPEGTARYNLDFEDARDGVSAPLRWYVQASGYAVALDTTVCRSGRASLKVAAVDTAQGGYAFMNQMLPTVRVAGREVCLTGWVRTQGAGRAALWIGGDDDAQWDIEESANPSVGGTSDWTQLTWKSRLSDTARLVIAVASVGDGTAWFDDLRITLDGEPLVDSLIPAPKSTLTRSEKRALRRYVYPLRTWEPDGGDADDLAVLHELVGNASVVGLGEATHGTREIFRMKDRIVRSLAEHEGFDIFSIEANMPESYAVGRYVAGGPGHAETLIAGMYFWTWNTASMRDMVQWMRDYNASEPRIAFTGFDMQLCNGPIHTLYKAFADDATARERIMGLSRELLALMGETGYILEPPANGAELAAAIAWLEDRIDAMPADAAEACGVPAGGDGRAWLRQQLTLLRQCLAGPGVRDRFMADNLLWIRAQNPDSRIAAWAHNGHVQKSDGYMGSVLKERLGDGYRAFGFAFYDGAYTAFGDGGLVSHPAQTPYPGTLEYLLGQLDEPLFILDLKRMREADDPMLAWLDALEYRRVGAVCQQQEFFGETPVSEDFDYLIFIRHTTPSRLLFAAEGTSGSDGSDTAGEADGTDKSEGARGANAAGAESGTEAVNVTEMTKAAHTTGLTEQTHGRV